MTPRGGDRAGCARLREIAPDVALGLLTGEERAEALAHLEGCEACRAEVASLAVAADEVLLAAPEATPPAGFDTRVLAALASQREAAEREGTASVAVPVRRHGWRRRAWVGAAAAAVVALVVGLVTLAGSGGPPSPSSPEPSAVATVAMRGNQGRVVGEATMTGSRPVQVVVDMPEWDDLVERWGEDPTGGYWLVLETRDGARTMQEIAEGDDDAAEVDWTMAVDVAATDVAAVSVVDGEGRVWCSGRFAT